MDTVDVDSDDSDDAAMASQNVCEPDMSAFFDADGKIDMRNFLMNVAGYYVKKAREELEDELTTWSLPTSEVRLISLCSGSGAGELAFESVVRTIGEELVKPLNPMVSFCCEKEAWKQTWLMSNIVVDSKVCVFDDVTTLGDDPKEQSAEAAITMPKNKAKAKTRTARPARPESGRWCVRHERACEIGADDKPVLVLKSGFSCKSNSKMNVKFSEFRSAMKNKDPNSCSVSTFFGTLSVIEKTAPKIVILENVDSAGNENKEDSNLQKIVAELETIAGNMYKVQVFGLSADKYFLPQRRTGSVRFLLFCCMVFPSVLHSLDS